MVKKALGLLVFIIGSLQASACLNLSDSTDLLFTAKVRCLENGYYSPEELLNTTSKLEARFISEGEVRNFQFILVQERKEMFDAFEGPVNVLHGKDTIVFTDFGKVDLEENKIAHEKNEIIGDCDYILAYSNRTNRYYYLKGFRTNDFKAFVDELKVYYHTSSLKFLDEIELEGLDLKCLIKSTKTRKELDCLRSCSERDRNFWKFR